MTSLNPDIDTNHAAGAKYVIVIIRISVMLMKITLRPTVNAHMP